MVGGLAAPPAEEEEQRELDAQRQVIFVLENAQLETAQVGKVTTWVEVGCRIAAAAAGNSSLSWAISLLVPLHSICRTI